MMSGLLEAVGWETGGTGLWGWYEEERLESPEEGLPPRAEGQHLLWGGAPLAPNPVLPRGGGSQGPTSTRETRSWVCDHRIRTGRRRERPGHRYPCQGPGTCLFHLLRSTSPASAWAVLRPAGELRLSRPGGPGREGWAKRPRASERAGSSSRHLPCLGCLEQING